MPQSGKMHEGDGSTPVPDPTLLTTAALTREIAALKELVATRLDAMDKAMTLFNENITRVPTDTDKQIRHLKELVWEKFATTMEQFNGIKTQFSERDSRRDTEAKLFSTAIDKAEVALTKQMDQQQAAIHSAKTELGIMISAVRDRVTRIEGEGGGEKASELVQRSESTNVINLLGLIIGSLLGVAGIIYGISQGAG
jgi:hypothetical protein